VNGIRVTRDAEVSRWLNCGTLLALLGVLVFVILGIALFQILCYGPGGAAPGSGWMRFPG
jgi:hypothetical protein